MESFLCSLAVLFLSSSSIAVHRNSSKIEQIRPWIEDYSDYIADEYLPEEFYDILEESSKDRVSGGLIVIPNSIPYQVGMALKKSERSTWCGGSLISNEFILTAAHCLDGTKRATVMLGAHDRSIKEEKGRINVIVKRKNFFLHEEFDRYSLRNDIALIKLSSPIDFTPEIQPIDLPWNFNTTFEHENVTFSGWGRYDSLQVHSKYLRQAASVIALNSECANYYKKFRAKTNICLDGSKGQGTCKGDSGGPTVVQSIENRTILIGLSSFGTSKGCDSRKPNVLTRITAFLSWIQRKTGIMIK